MASIDVFERLDEWETIPILIRRLEKENGRLREDIIEVLQKIAGPSSKAPSSHEAKHWLQWWSAHGSNLDGRNPDDASEAAYRTVSATAGSLGRIYSKKFLFLVDISSSMMQGIWTVDEDGKPLALKPKIAYVVEELERVIEGLEEEVEFNVLMFASEVQPWRESIAQATSKNKKSATRWLKYLELGTNQTTDLHSALETVLEQADAGLEGGTTESVIDTMYLISDGMPTAGVTDAQALLSWLTERNRAHKIRLNVITLGATDTDLGLLNKFAEANGGKCLVITN